MKPIGTIHTAFDEVRGVDMLDGTPLLDIKPYVPAFDEQEAVRLGWLEPHLQELREKGLEFLADSRFTREARESLDLQSALMKRFRP